MKELINLDIPHENKLELINTIKILLYKKEPRIFDELIKDDDFFFNPLLFAFFNQKINCSLDVLNSILYNNTYVAENKLIEFSIIKIDPVFLKPFFFEYYRGNITNPNPDFKNTWESYYELAEKALVVIKEKLPVFYNELIFSNNTLFFHDNTKIINFVTKKTQGLLYFNTLPENNEIYFIEEFIHQGSHNFLNIFLHDKSKWFVNEDLINVSMSELTNNRNDYRTFFSMFHGLYTVSKRIECFNILLKKNVFKREKKHELLGRMTDEYLRFFRGGYDNKIKLENILTKNGIELYFFLFNSSKSILKKYDSLPVLFDLNNRDVDFRYSTFCKFNPYEKFLKNDTNNYYQF